MRNIALFSAIFFMAGSIFAAPLNLTGTVKALSESGVPVENAVVLLKMNDGLIAYARTLSGSDGNFVLLPNKAAPGEITPIARTAAFLPVRYASYQAMDLKGRTHSTNSLPQGIYVLLGKTENGRSANLGTIYHKGGALKVGEVAQKEQKVKSLARSQTSSGDEIQLVVRKTGYLPKEVLINSFDENVGTVVLERDPLEARIDEVMASMSLKDKIYQMTQPLVLAGNSSGGSLFGSVLHGGGDYSSTFLNSMANALNSWAGNVKIPVSYGKDFVHGATEVNNATIFPHNIGLGATRDSALVRKIGEAIAKESWAAKVDMIFSPAISVPQNERWGRVYEGFGETAELAVMMGAAMVRGLQGEKYNAPWRVTATAKHYLADGSTDNGKDRGNNATITDQELREIHLPGYEAVVEQGVLSVMASFNQIKDVHQHVDSMRLTGWLKTELGFDGYIISDWLGIATSECPGCTGPYGAYVPDLTSNAVRNAINAGIDLAMEPGNHATFINHLTTLANNCNNGQVSCERIDDAVRRILRAKFRAGRMDNIPGPTEYSNLIGAAAHRQIAREAVRKSLVLLKNQGNALPISKSAKVYVFGSHANDHGYQCGGWTKTWQGISGNIGGATSIQSGIDQVMSVSRVSAATADIIIYVTGETPYAEWEGDISDITFNDNNASQLNTYKSQGKKVVTVFISGRPMETNSLLNASDAFVAAWLPGSEGAGIADVLFESGGEYNFTGKLPHTWPRNKSVFPVNSTQESPDWFPYGYGLSY